MSAVREPAITPTRRVRHGVRDGIVLMAFSISTSVALGLLLALATEIGKR